MFLRCKTNPIFMLHLMFSSWQESNLCNISVFFTDFDRNIIHEDRMISILGINLIISSRLNKIWGTTHRKMINPSFLSARQTCIYESKLVLYYLTSFGILSLISLKICLRLFLKYSQHGCKFQTQPEFILQLAFNVCPVCII